MKDLLVLSGAASKMKAKPAITQYLHNFSGNGRGAWSGPIKNRQRVP